MSYFDYNLKFTDQDNLEVTLHNAGIIDIDFINDSKIITQCAGFYLDIIGTLPKYNPDPEAPIIMGEGYHANLRCDNELSEEVKAVLPIIPAPKFPKRIWSGDE